MHVLAAYFFHYQGHGYNIICDDHCGYLQVQISSANVTELVSLEMSSFSYLYENQLSVQLNM